MYYYHEIYEDKIRYHCKNVNVIICIMRDSPQYNSVTNNYSFYNIIIYIIIYAQFIFNGKIPSTFF